MISREELRRLSRATGLGLYQQEKDYALKLFLFLYYRRKGDAVFKGGTCLRYAHGTQRFSEDLDFNVADPGRFSGQVEAVLREMRRLGMGCGLLRGEAFPGSYACEVWLDGPLSDGTRQTRNRFRVDAGARLGTVLEPRWLALRSEYPETGPRFLALCMDEREMLAEKVLAMSSRGKGRDLYDAWFLLSSGVPFQRALFKRKGGGAVRFPPEKDYEGDMSRLAPAHPPYKQARGDVERALGG